MLMANPSMTRQLLEMAQKDMAGRLVGPLGTLPLMTCAAIPSGEVWTFDVSEHEADAVCIGRFGCWVEEEGGE